MPDLIRCPHCRAEFEVTEAVAQQLREQMRHEIEEDVARREQLLQRRQRDLDRTLQERLDAERPRMLQELRGAVDQELKDTGDALAETQRRLAQAQAAELELRRERRELEEQRRELELTVQRTLDAERATMQAQIRKDADEQYRLKIAEKDKHNEDLCRQIDELKRKAAPVPPQTQGEVLELDLQEFLRARFPQDELVPVPVGQHGGDIIQHVRDDAGRACGSILWESKRTKSWQAAWLPKLREDQRLAKARLAILVSQEMPRDVPDFGCIDGIHICRRACAAGLAAVLRFAVIGVAQAERSVQNRHGKSEQLIAYVCSNEFQLRVAGLVEALTNMREDFDKEKRTIERLWAKRLKQIELAMSSTLGFRGDLEAILGAGLCLQESDAA